MHSNRTWVDPVDRLNTEPLTHSSESSSEKHDHTDPSSSSSDKPDDTDPSSSFSDKPDDTDPSSSSQSSCSLPDTPNVNSELHPMSSLSLPDDLQLSPEDPHAPLIYHQMSKSALVPSSHDITSHAHHPDQSESNPLSFTGVGWLVGTQQTKSNFFKGSKSLSADPPRSNELVDLVPFRSFDTDPDFIPSPEDPNCLRHAEFGFDPDENQYMWESRVDNNKAGDRPLVQEAGYLTYLTTYWSYLLVFLIGHVRDAFGKRFAGQSHAHLKLHNGYAALNSDFDSFFTRRVKSRLDDCFGRPVTGAPARTITILDRTSADNCVSFKYTQTTTQALNISSYNYLGFAQSRGSCADAVQSTIQQLGMASAGARDDAGLSALLVETEKLMASFLKVEDAMLISQGFASNSTTLPCLVGKGDLVISDEYNHNSIRFGTRLSGAMVRTYKHNDMVHLERVLRESISQGQPRRLRAWRKIIIVVEGIYSMEGTIVDLPNLLRLKEKYKFYIYLDEAHSIGALGPNGRGACDYYGIDPSRIDVMMGTLTKSFGASGGYIAGNKSLIDHMRKNCHSSIYAEAFSPPVISQIQSAVKLIMAHRPLELGAPIPEGTRRLRRLAFNVRYLRAGLLKLGFIVVGDRDSPVIPLLVYQPGKLLLFSRLMLQRYSIVVVVVGYPATPLVLGRVRFCVSASHTKQDIDRVLIATNEIGEALGLKLNSSPSSWTIDQVVNHAKSLVVDCP